MEIQDLELKLFFLKKKSNNKDKININNHEINKEYFKSDLDVPELDIDDNGLFDSVFGEEQIIDIEQDQSINKNFIINKKRKRDIYKDKFEEYPQNLLIKNFDKFIK